MRSLALFLFPWVILGCGAKPSQRAVVVEEIVQGNPEGFIRGARLQPAMTVEDVRELAGWFVYREIVRRERTSRVAMGDRIRSQDPRQRRVVSEQVQALALVERDRTIVLRDALSKQSFRFGADSDGQRWTLRAVGETEVEALHFSRHRQYEVASLLARDPRTGDLLTYYFASRSAIGASRRNESRGPIYFVAPPAGRWRQKQLTVDLCGLGEAMTKAGQWALEQWREALSGRLEIVTRVQEVGYAPFSDLNQQCIYQNTEYRSGIKDAHLGETWLLEIDSRQRFVDGDIFMYGREFARLLDRVTDAAKRAAFQRHFELGGMVHELGHLLGLDHQPGALKSVMNSGELESLQEFDRAAIRTLYDLP